MYYGGPLNAFLHGDEDACTFPLYTGSCFWKSDLIRGIKGCGCMNVGKTLPFANPHGLSQDVTIVTIKAPIFCTLLDITFLFIVKSNLTGTQSTLTYNNTDFLYDWFHMIRFFS
jgi:hypothetical protein